MTNSTGADGGYADYTSLSAAVSQGSTNTLIISTGFSGTAYTEYWKIWIDYDQNGTFDDDEIIMQSEGFISFKILDIMGQVVKEGQLSDKKINVSNLNSGIYLLEVNDGQKIFKSKLIKK